MKFGRSFDRIPHPDAALEESISEVMLPTNIIRLSDICMCPLPFFMFVDLLGVGPKPSAEPISIQRYKVSGMYF